MPTVTAQSILTAALEDLGVLAIGETPENALTAQGLRRLNQIVRGLRLDHLAIPYSNREVFPLVTNQGGIDNPYRIGPGGDFDTSRPDTIDGAGIVYPVSVSTQRYEVPIGLLTDDQYQAITTKSLTSTFPLQIYYQRTYADGLGQIVTWPIPNNDDYSLAIYRWMPVAEFSTLTAEFDVPDGYDEMLEYQLAVRWAPSFLRAVPEPIAALAVSSLAQIKRATLGANLSDLSTDAALLTPKKFINIFTGQNVT